MGVYLKKDQSKKLLGRDVYICIDSSKYPDLLTNDKPYRVKKGIYYNKEIFYLIKGDDGVDCWIEMKFFRERR